MCGIMEVGDLRPRLEISEQQFASARGFAFRFAFRCRGDLDLWVFRGSVLMDRLMTW